MLTYTKQISGIMIRNLDDLYKLMEWPINLRSGRLTGGTKAGQFAWAGIENISKEIIANRGDLKYADGFDVTTSTLASGLGIYGRIGVELLNVSTDINIANGFQSVVIGSKSQGAAVIDFMFGYIKFTGGEIGTATGGSKASKTIFELRLDQTKNYF